MPIKVGDRLPETKFRVMGPDGPAWKTTDEIFKGKKVALFAVPGAFTNTCHKMHMPSIVQNADAITGKGVNTIAVTSVNSANSISFRRKMSHFALLRRLQHPNRSFNRPSTRTIRSA